MTDRSTSARSLLRKRGVLPLLACLLALFIMLGVAGIVWFFLREPAGQSTTGAPPEPRIVRLEEPSELLDDLMGFGQAHLYEQIGLIGTPGSTARSLAVSSDGTRVAAGLYNGVVGMWEIASGKSIWLSKRHSESVEAIAFVDNGRRLVTGSLDKTGRLWDAADGHEIYQWPHHSPVAALAVSPDGRQFLFGEAEGVALLQLKPDEAAGSSRVRRWGMTGFDGSAKSVAFSPDGRSAVVGATDGTIRHWDLGTQVRRFEGRSDVVSSVHFSPDGRFVISGGWDQTLRVWNAESGQQVALFQAATQCTQRIAISPDGRYTVSGGGRVRVAGAKGYADEGQGDILFLQLPKNVWSTVEEQPMPGVSN